MRLRFGPVSEDLTEEPGDKLAKDRHQRARSRADGDDDVGQIARGGHAIDAGVRSGEPARWTDRPPPLHRRLVQGSRRRMAPRHPPSDDHFGFVADRRPAHISVVAT
jgi:hypothetical protein